MPTVEMNHQISGGREGAHWPAKGGRLEVSADEAEQLVRTGAARLVQAIEATVAAVENRVESATAPTGAVETATVNTEPAK